MTTGIFLAIAKNVKNNELLGYYVAASVVPVTGVMLLQPGKANFSFNEAN